MMRTKQPQQRRARALARKFFAANSVEAQSFEKLLHLASSYGLRVALARRCDIGCQWDGRRQLRIEMGSQVAGLVSDLAHELGHWAVATRRERALPDYGLGSTYPPKRSTPPPAVRSSTADTREAQASIFGMMLEDWAGHNLSYTWALHQWDCPVDLWLMDRTLRQLQQKHLITEEPEHHTTSGPDLLRGWVIPMTLRLRGQHASSRG